MDTKAARGPIETIESKDVKIPPDDVRCRVDNQYRPTDDYLWIGRDGIDAILHHLARHGNLPEISATVLDFGCGCARSIQPFRIRRPHWRFVGTDIDEVTVNWSREHVAGSEFDVNGAHPPLRYEARSFDLVYALSVFSHLDAKMEDEWLFELARIIKPGGFLYLTFTGQYVLNKVPGNFPPEAQKQYHNSGFAYFANIGDGILPSWYQTSLQSGEYIASRLDLVAPDLLVREHLLGGHLGWQDSLLAQKA